MRRLLSLLLLLAHEDLTEGLLVPLPTCGLHGTGLRLFRPLAASRVREELLRMEVVSPQSTELAARVPSVSTPQPPPRGNASVEESVRFLAAAVLIGVLTGLAITVFKTTIAEIADLCYKGDEVVMPLARRVGLGGFAVFIPAVGGLAVGLLRLSSPRGQLGPGLAEHVAQVERAVPCNPTASVARSAAAAATLGTGNSLGPEGPSVEVGIAISRVVADALAKIEQALSGESSGNSSGAGVGAEGGGSLETVREAEAGGSGKAGEREPAFSKGVVTPAFPWRYDDGLTDGGGDVDGLALRRHRQLIAAGAAAGVAAGFNAPLAGVFFALEVVSEAVRSAVVAPEGLGSDGRDERVDLSALRDSAELDIKSKEAISATVISALVAALVVQATLGNELALQPGEFTVTHSLIELPAYVGLGALSGSVALLFQLTSGWARNLFNMIDGGAGPPDGSIGAGGGSAGSDNVPRGWQQQGWGGVLARPVAGGLACGLIGLMFPQILFFGYSTLDAILATGSTPAASEFYTLDAILSSGSENAEVAAQLLAGSSGGFNLLDLLFAKLLATSLCVGAGLVGGTFAPSLFLGAALGVAYQSFAGQTLAALADAIAAYQTSIGVEVGSWGVIPQLTVADTPAYAMIGAAAVLASVFRAPLTASLLLFELTRAYDIVLPVLAATGTGPLVVEFVRKQGMPSLGGGAGSSRLSSLKKEEELPDACDIDNAILCEDVDFPSDEEVEEDTNRP